MTIVELEDFGEEWYRGPYTRDKEGVVFFRGLSVKSLESKYKSKWRKDVYPSQTKRTNASRRKQIYLFFDEHVNKSLALIEVDGVTTSEEQKAEAQLKGEQNAVVGLKAIIDKFPGEDVANGYASKSAIRALGSYFGELNDKNGVRRETANKIMATKTRKRGSSNQGEARRGADMQKRGSIMAVAQAKKNEQQRQDNLREQEEANQAVAKETQRRREAALHQIARNHAAAAAAAAGMNKN